MKAITREEKIMSGEKLTPITRKELFLAKAAGMAVETPMPITREEMFLDKIQGGGGGGSTLPSQHKELDITENGIVEVTPDYGYTLSRVVANVNVESESKTEVFVPTNDVEIFVVTTEGAFTLQDFSAAVGGSGNVAIQLVNTLPEKLIVSNTVDYIYVYVVESTGTAYANFGSGNVTAGMMVFMDDSFNKGWTTDINSVTEQGVYCVRKNSGGGGADDIIVGTWVFNDEVAIPADDGNFDVHFDVHVDGITTHYNSIEFYEGQCLGYYGDESETDDVYVDGWRNEENKTITITEEPTDETFIAWLKANAKKKVNPLVYTVRCVDELPNDAPDGSVAIVEGERAAMANTTRVLNEYFESKNPAETDIKWLPVRYINGYDNEQVAIIFTDVTDGWCDVKYVDVYGSILGVYDDGWGKDIDRIINIIEEPTTDVAKWLETHSTKTDGANLCITTRSLYIHENGEWVYEREVELSDGGVDKIQRYIELNGNSAEYMFYQFKGTSVDEIMDGVEFSSVTDTSYMFAYCSKLTTVPQFDTRNVTSMSGMLDGCKALTECWIRNIKANLQVSNGTSYGHLLTLESLLHLCKECRKTTSSKTLTVGTANLAKLEGIYVKLIDITDEMRAEDDLIDEKYPFVQCESTDADAMTIQDYMALKMWSLA